MTRKRFDLQMKLTELQNLVQDALAELADANDSNDVGAVRDMYLGVGHGLISQRLNPPVMKMNVRWASWRRHSRAVCHAITAVEVAIKERYEEIDADEEAVKEEQS